MEIGGMRVRCLDGVIRPTISADVITASGSTYPEMFVVDTGADRTVFCSSTFQRLGIVGDDSNWSFNLERSRWFCCV